MNSTKQSGMPIYLDPVDRNVADLFVEGKVDVDDWYPSNKAAHKLWRCLECLRDLDELLEGTGNQKNVIKKKRCLKIATTSLHSLVLALDDLLNDIQCNKETSELLSDKEVKQVKEISIQFSKMLPHDHKSPLSLVRNKLSAHVDKKIHPTEAREIANIITPSGFGRWLHICLHLVLDLTKLDIYYWGCNSSIDGHVQVMTNEPYLVTYKVDGNEIREIAGVHIAKNSPKSSIQNVVNSLVKNSQWMFKPGQPRIGSLKEDTKENWNTFLSNYTLG